MYKPSYQTMCNLGAFKDPTKIRWSRNYKATILCTCNPEAHFGNPTHKRCNKDYVMDWVVALSNMNLSPMPSPLN